METHCDLGWLSRVVVNSDHRKARRVDRSFRWRRKCRCVSKAPVVAEQSALASTVTRRTRISAALPHLLLRDKASWVEPQIGANDDCFDGYPELSIEDWHKKHGLWVK